MSDLAKRLTDRAKAFNDAGLTHGVADLLAEAAAELVRVEQALEREGLKAVISAAIDDGKRDRTNDEFDAHIAASIRTHVLGDNEGKTK